MATKRTYQRRRGGRLTEERHDEIVTKAAALFLDRGYEAVSMDDIIAAVGGSKATVYARFGGKAGLFITAIEHHCAEITRNLSIEFDPDDTLEQQLVRIGDAFLTLILDDKTLKLHRLIVSLGDRFPNVSRTFYEAGPLSAYRLVAHWVKRQQDSSTLQAGDPLLLASLYLDMLTGRHQLARLTGRGAGSSRKSLTDTVRWAARIYLQGLAKPRRRR